MKAPNGFGSVYKLQGNRRRPWMARVTEGFELEDDKQKQKFHIIGYFETKKDAMSALVAYKDNPIPLKAGITFQEIYDEWSKTKYEYVGKKAKENYQGGWNYLSKHGRVKMNELRTSQLQAVINSCHKSGKSHSLLSKIRLVAGMLFDYAMENDIVMKNYAKFIKLPKKEKTQKKIFNDLEIKKLERAELGSWESTILILIYSGMRINEMLGLTKFSVDWDKQIITGGLKTDAGKDRIIPIHTKILKHVKYWYNKKGEYLICKEDGKKINDRYYRENYYFPTLEKLEIRKELNPHCCRHTFATLMANAGVDPIAIQLIIGHADYAFTANTYTHTDVDFLKKAMEKI